MAKLYGHWITVNYRESYDLYASLGDPLQPREPAARARVRHAQGDPRRRPHQGRPRSELRLGNLEAKRDWGYAGDYVRAMWSMLQQRQPRGLRRLDRGDASVRELCEVAFGRAGLDWEDHVVVDDRFFRPAEVDMLVGDSSKARRSSAGSPRWISCELVEMMVDADIDLVRRQQS